MANVRNAETMTLERCFIRRIKVHAHTSYNIRINGTDAEIEAINKVLREAVTDEKYNGGREIKIEETYTCTFPEEVEALAARMASVSPNSEFFMEGVIDTSESAGEFMDFAVKFTDGKLLRQFSDWYLETCLEYYEGFDDFVDEWGEEVPEVDELYFNKFKEENEFAFFLETKDGMMMVSSVPLGDEIEVDY